MRTRSTRLTVAAALATMAMLAGGTVAVAVEDAAPNDAGAADEIGCQAFLGNYSVNGSTVTIPTRTTPGDWYHWEYRYRGGAWLSDANGDVTITGVTSGIHSVEMRHVFTQPGNAPVTTVYPNQTFAVEPARIAGSSRYDTAIEINRAIGVSCGTLYLASGQGFADALAAAPLAAGQHMLLTRSDSLTAATLAEINRVQPTDIVILGGPTTISTTIEQQLRQAGHQVSRVAGSSRYDTALLLAENRVDGGWWCEGWSETTGCIGGPAPAAFVVTGQNFPDAISAGTAAATEGVPVLLVPGNASSLSAEIVQRFNDAVDGPLTILGGTGSVSAGIEQQLERAGFEVERLAGANRYETNVMAIRHSMEYPGPHYSNIDFVATGRNYPDALTGGVIAGYRLGNVYLAPATCIMPSTAALMAERDATARVLLGDASSLSPNVLQTVCS